MQPTPRSSSEDRPVQCACPLAFALGDGYGLDIAGPAVLDQRFAEACLRYEQRAGWPAAARYFLDQGDEWDRETMRRGLQAEVEWAPAQRHDSISFLTF